MLQLRPILLFLCVGSSTVPGQNPSLLVHCRGQRIDSINIDTQAPTVTGLRRVPVVGEVVRRAHVITRDAVVRGFLLLQVGDRCSELQRAESERILRAQPFIADALIEVIGNRSGGVTLEVKTIDEASMIIGGTVANQGPALRGLRLGSGNVAGLGMLASVGWHYQPVLNDEMEIRISHYQFAGQPYVLSLASVRDPLGRDDHGQMTFPFRTDLQRLAWRTLVGESRANAAFVSRDSGLVVLGYNQEYAEIGGIARVGPPGKLSLFGLSFTNERALPDAAPNRLNETGLHPDTASELSGRFLETKAARVNFLVGLRGIRFMRVRGFDALRATQDVPLGLQIGTLVGRAVPVFGANSNDVFVATDLYVGIGTPRQAYRLQFRGEGRSPRGLPWDGLVGSGKVSRYSRIGDRRTRVLSVEWSGTSRVLLPHSLSLGPTDGGVRGYNNATSIGNRRGVARVDEQFYFGSPFKFADVGAAWFADAGQLWRGDLPYGQTTRPRTSVGAGLLLAAPMRSARTWRLELAVPLNREPGTSPWEVRLSHSDHTSFFWREPPDIVAARTRTAPSSVYSWP